MMMRHPAMVLVVMLLFGAANAEATDKLLDRFGKPDKITVEIAPLPIKGQWVAGIVLENDEELAAITVPLKFGERVGQFRFDSARFDDTRVSYFALKTTNSQDTLNSVLVGLLYSLADERLPLTSGIGQVARLYFTQQGKVGRSPLPPTIDSTFFPPFNTLELVTPGADPIKPLFATIRVEKLTVYQSPADNKTGGPDEKEK